MQQTGSWYFYVIECADRTMYAGIATDVVRRFNEHSVGVGAKYLRPQKRRPMKLVLVEYCATRSVALKREAKFKKMIRTRKLAYIMGFRS